ncbi:Transcription termination factor mterf2, chloroplastic [Ancistrocladus abbreviatus]
MNGVTEMLCSANHHLLTSISAGGASSSASLLHLSTNTAQPSKPFTTFFLSLHQQNPNRNSPTVPKTQEPILRTHNSKSTSILLHHLSGSSPHQQQQKQKQREEEAEDQCPPNDAGLSEEERIRLLEMSLVRKRNPQFPGSIYARPPHSSEPSLPPLATLFRDNDGDDETLMRAIEIRRKVTLEVFIERMRKRGQFGITYSTNLASKLPEFIDFVMIEAAAMKKLPEFSKMSFNVRARTFIDESNVVPLVRWFKHNSLSYPQIGRIICISRGNLESVRRLVEWLKTIHVGGRFLGVVFMRVGETILSRNMEELDEIVEYLESKGVRMDWMGYVICRCPELLAFSIEEVKTRVKFYTDMGMSAHDFGTMVYDCPKVLGYFSLEEMKDKVTYLKEFGLGNEDVGRLLAFKPQLMVCSIEEKFKPLIKYLYYLGVCRDGMKRILVIKPMVFCVDLEATIVPKVRFLQDLGIKDDAIGQMLVKFPPFLTYSLYKKIRPVVIFLLTKAGVAQKHIAKIVASAPELLGCSIAHKLDGNVKYFVSLGISIRQLGEMIADFPMLLRYNVELLRPKYRYLRRTMVRPLQDLIEFPRYFSYSLDERIIPRHKVLVENRINFKLRYMLASSDEEFRKRVQAAVERRQRFESGIICTPQLQGDESLWLTQAPCDTEGTDVDESQTIDPSPTFSDVRLNPIHDENYDL